MSMQFAKLALCMAVTGLVAIGCDTKEDTAPMSAPVAPAPTPAPTPTPAPVTPSMNDDATHKMDQAKDMAGNAMNGAKDAAGNAMDAGKAAASDASTKMSDMKNNMTGTTGDAMTGVNAMSSADVEKTANDMIAKVKTYISENKLDDANSTLTKLEEMKAKLPQSLQDQIAKLRPMLDAAKNMKMPSMPGMK